MMSSQNRAFIIVLSIILFSCQQYRENIRMDIEFAKEQYNQLIPISQLPLYADMSPYNVISSCKTGVTKSNEQIKDSLVRLNSLLDFYNKKEIVFFGTCFTQIPFFDNDSDSFMCLFNAGEAEQSTNLSHIKKFLVHTRGEKGLRSFIVTMIAEAEYQSKYPEYDYLYKPNMSGFVLFSSLEGTLIDARYYKNGLVYRADVLVKDSSNETTGNNSHFMSLLEVDSQTKSSDYTLDPAICIAYVINPSFCIASNWALLGNGQYPYWSFFANSGHNGTDSDLEYDDEGVPEDEETPEDLLLPVYVTCNLPAYIQMFGTGEYTEGTWAYIGYAYKYDVVDFPFLRWVGGFSGIKTGIFAYKVSKPIESTAYFFDGEAFPCTDTLKGVTNPLVLMKVAPSNLFGNYRGGTYGMNRISKNTLQPKLHQGLDLIAEPGTPIHSMYSGVVSAVFMDAPNNNVENSYGNKIEITSDITTLGLSSTITVLYAHLQYGNPVAINPRTGMTFKVGDKVYPGELIGYSGMHLMCHTSICMLG